METAYISYSHKDKNFVNRLVGDLEAAGICLFYDEKLKPGQNWKEALDAELQNSHYLLVVLSPNYFHSDWAMEELNKGIVQEGNGASIVIPLMIQDCSLPSSLEKKLFANFLNSYEEGLSKLLTVFSEATQIGIVPKQITQTQEKGLDTSAKYTPSNEPDKKQEAIALHAEISKKSSPVPGKRRKCFIVMPFGNPDLQIVYFDFIRPVIEKLKLICERGDDLSGSNMIMDDILTSIKNADIIVADLTGKNPNVFYEIGISHALGKPVLLLAQKRDDVPFDVQHLRILFYDYTPQGCKILEKKLKEHVSKMIKNLGE